MKSWRKYLPYLDFVLDVKLIAIRTALWRESVDSYSFDYVVAEIYVMGKVVFRFKLYTTEVRRINR